MSIFDYFTPEARRGNREWLDSQNAAISEALRYYLGPTGIPDRLGLLAESTPTAGLERAGAESSRMFEPGLSGAQRAEAFGNMLSETAGAGAGLLGMPVAGKMADDLVQAAAPTVGRFMRGDEGTLRYRRDASDIFGAGTQRAMYDDPATGGYMEMLERPSGPASVLELFVPEGMRGQGGGKRLLEEVMQNNPRMMGQVSSKAAAKTAYAAGRRPADMPNATLDDVFRMIDEDSSVNLVSPAELEARGLLSTVATDAATRQGSEIINLLRSGRAGEVTEQMLDMGDPVLNARLSEYLYSNYDLPMDTASRMGRAGGMGFVDALHGTGDEITAVDPSFFGSGQDLLGSGFYTTTAPARAERYVPREKSPGIEVSKNYAEGGNILPLSVREPMPFDLKEPLGKTADDIANYYANDPFFSIEKTSSGVTYVKDFDGNSVMLDPMQPKHWALQNLRKAFGPSETSNALSDLGFSGVSGPELGGNVVRNSYDPTDVRSRFARFDPRLSHLRNLNAGLATGVPLGLLAMQPGSEPQ